MSSANETIIRRHSLELPIAVFIVGCGLAIAAFLNAYPKEALYALALFSSISVLMEPLLGLTVAVASLPWFGFTLIPDAFSLTKGVTALTCMALALRLGMGVLTFPPIPRSFRWYAFALVFSLTTSLVTPGYNELFLESIQTPILTGFFPFLFLVVLTNYDELKFLCIGGIIAGSALVVAILILGIEAFVTSDVQMRLAVGTNENELGQVLTMCLALCLIVGAGTTAVWRVIISVSGLLIAYAILLTQSRGTWVGMLFATAVTTFFVPGLSFKQRFTFVATFLFVGVLSIFLVVYDFGGVGEFFEARTFELFQKGTAVSAGRIEWIWPLWLDTIWEHPLIGIGVGGSSSVLSVNPHNDMLSLLGERGILGFSLYMIFLGLIFRESLRNSVVSFRCISLWILLFLLGSGMFSESIFLKSYGMGIGLVEVLNNLGAARNGQSA